MNYIIKGGEFNNKGAEAMSLIAIYNIINKDPKAKIYFNDIGYNNSLIFDLPVIPFRIIPSYMSYLIGKNMKNYLLHRCKNFLNFFLKHSSYIKRKDYSEVIKILVSADYFIDISGFALSSQWGINKIINYLTWLEVIKKENPKCKIFLMPQSFGPFDKTFDYRSAFNILSKCERIYAREKKGFDALVGMGLTNVEYCYDSVLIEKKYHPSLIINDFDKYSKLISPIEPESVAIIPNKRIIDVGRNDSDKLKDMYKKIIDVILLKHKVILIPHAGEDLELCKSIKSNYLINNNVILIDKVLNSFNYEEMIKNTSYIVASRYHSIIHAYKEGTPAIILGWAEKYNEIARTFNQERYIIDVNDVQETINVVNRMENEYKNERKEIAKRLIEIQKEYNCYSFLGELNENK